MLCPKCGSDSPKNIRFCTECGSPILEATDKEEKSGGNLIGYSARIKDPAFAKYIKNSKTWSYLFASILAVAAVVGFYIYGETSSEMENPEALFIGLGIGGMFLVIALFQSIGRNKGTTWDGVIVDKKIENKKRKRKSGNRNYWQKYVAYTVFVKSDSGKTYVILHEDDDTVFNYFEIGDKVRHHKGLNTYEKYDKSRDSIIFCNACGSLNEIKNDKCFRCGCPLLK